MSVFTFKNNKVALIVTAIVCCIANSGSYANGFGPLPMSLTDMEVPAVPGLLDGASPIIIDREKAIILGKALFWDTNVGSDGMACASCHFQAGVDSRIKNQISSGGHSTSVVNQVFDDSISGQYMGVNHILRRGDFPFHQRENPLFDTSPITHDSDDVVSSAGTFGGIFKRAARIRRGNDGCIRSADPVFHVGALGTRRVQSRNTPTVLNAIFNHRSFWDGRANNVFNGSSSWGDRDPDAGVWVKVNGREVSKQRLHLINSSLASQALAPPLNTGEMTCADRSLPDLGQKLLMRRPLEHQKVHYQDSVLGPLSRSSEGDLQPGLNTTYMNLIRQSFNKKYWSYRRTGVFGRPDVGLPYRQIEANFGMFFALAIQLYESTLVTDQSPFDLSVRDADGIPTDLSSSEINGLKLFRDNNCAHCHTGPNFTTASIVANAAFAKIHPEAFGNSRSAVSTTTNVVTRTLLADGVAFFDTGFTATGVVEVSTDIGLGGSDDFGNPLSFSKQYLQFLAGNHSDIVDLSVSKVRPCDFQEAFAVNITFPFLQNNMFTPEDGIKPQIQSTENCFSSNFAFLPTEAVATAELESPDNHKMLHAVNGAFKIPSLRNVELTGPYMHNGGLATLEQVIEFYSRGGNFSPKAKQSEKVFPLHFMQNSSQNRTDLIAFLKTLTDDRVRYEKAPFDHPEIKIPHGHAGNKLVVREGNLAAGLARDEFLVIDAVGARGNVLPLLPFKDYLLP